MNAFLCCGMVCEPESRIQYQWQTLVPGTVLKTRDGQSVVVESVGTWNGGAGPDFVNARLCVDGEVWIGDIEIHHSPSDWFAHGHHHDLRYDRVILHVVRHDAASAPDLPTLVLDDEPQMDDFFPGIEEGDCAGIIADIPDQTLTDIILDAGFERLTLKTESVCRTMIDCGTERTALRLIFDVAGYKNNRLPFAELFRRWDAYPLEIRVPFADVILWGESGLLPDVSLSETYHPLWRAEICRLRDAFWTLRKGHAAPLNWSRGGSRPFNSPERRLAALIALVRQCDAMPCRTWCDALSFDASPKQNLTALIDTLSLPKNPYDSFYNFKMTASRPAAIQGDSRIRELLANALLPVLCAHGWLVKNQNLSHIARDIWSLIPAAQENRVIQTAMARCFGLNQKHRAKKLLRTFAAQQGLTHLYLNFCEQNQSVCTTCRMIHGDSGENPGK